ncbi:MAG: hypothetical protein OXP09_14900, partial [Gammaproteobacteria bacterium]|nr:hypothetical protein [Gammaproteobacteria bacterium]
FAKAADFVADFLSQSADVVAFTVDVFAKAANFVADAPDFVANAPDFVANAPDFVAHASDFLAQAIFATIDPCVEFPSEFIDLAGEPRCFQRGCLSGLLDASHTALTFAQFDVGIVASRRI